MSNLNGKKVLFIAQKIYGYEYEIKATIESLGASVVFYHERPYNIVYKTIKNISSSYVDQINKLFFDKMLSEINKNIFDYVFIIRAEIVTVNFLEKLRLSQPKAIFIMYQWDSIKLNPYQHLVPFFDRVYSFDMADCKRNQAISYFPLFYRREYETMRNKNINESNIDLLLIGTFHHSRQELIQTISTICKANNINFYYHLFLPKEGYFKEIIKGKKLLNVSTRQLSTDSIVELYSKAKVILDLPQKGQDGFTMRTFEVLGSGKKLMTTNKNIIHSDFYDPNYISVFDVDNILLDFDFIYSQINEDENFYDKMGQYSLKNWIIKIFES